MQSDEVLMRKADYLNATGFQLRAVVYWVLWIVIAGLAVVL